MCTVYFMSQLLLLYFSSEVILEYIYLFHSFSA